MYKFFGRLFIKDYLNTKDEMVRSKYGSMAGIIGIVSNLLLGLLKVVFGIITLSISIITDAINNITDSLSSIITTVGYKLSIKKADEDHPFGHQRIEFISGLIVAVLMFSIAAILFKESITKIIEPVELKLDYVTVIILGVSIIIKVWQSFFYRSVSKAIDSVSLKALSRDSLNDAISTLCVLIGALVFIIFDTNVDGYVGLLLSCYVIYSSIKLIFEASSPLIGEIPDKDIILGYKKDIMSYEGILGVHDIVCHSYGPTKLFMTAHAEVDSRVPILISHEIIDNIERDFREQKNIDLTIHLDPIDYNDEFTKNLRNEIRKKIKDIDARCDIHDFRVVRGENHTNVIFDCEIPVDFKYTKNEMKNIINDIVKGIDSSYYVVLQIDQLYDRI
ncbi:cation transporter [bacterium]|nr:cation transporter [bacterium]